MPLKPSPQLQALVELIELKVRAGHDISPYIGRSVSWFNYQIIKLEIKNLRQELEG